MFGVEALLLSVAAVVNVAVIGLIYSEKRLSPHSSLYVVGSLSLAFWAVTMLYFETATDAFGALVALKGTYAAALLTALSLYFFSYAFPDGQTPGALHRLAVLGLVLGSVVFVEYPSSMVDNLVMQAGVVVTIELIPLHYLLFASVLVALLGASLCRMWIKYARSRGRGKAVRRQLLALTAGATVSGGAGLYVGLLLPSPFFNDYSLFWTGPVFIIFLSTAVIYAIFRYRAFDVRALIGEFIVYLLWIFTFIRTLLPGELLDHALNGTLFLLTVFLGLLLVRSMRSEAMALEKTAELAKNLERANARLTDLDRQKTEFVSLASHQLRGPVTAVRGYISLLLEDSYGPISDGVRGVLQKIGESGQNMALMIEDFLDVSRIELGIMKYAKEDFDLRALAADIAFEAEGMAKEKGLAWDASYPAQAVMVHGDRAKLRQVILNLADNAVKYTPRGSVSLALGADERRGVARVTVQDTGIGIPHDGLFKLFEKFVRVRNVTDMKGAGLGLWVAREFVKAHGGQIWAESPGEGKGSTFRVELPLQKNV